MVDSAGSAFETRIEHARAVVSCGPTAPEMKIEIEVTARIGASSV